MKNHNPLAEIAYKFKQVYDVDPTTCPDLFGAFVAGYIQYKVDLEQHEIELKRPQDAVRRDFMKGVLNE